MSLNALTSYTKDAKLFKIQNLFQNGKVQHDNILNRINRNNTYIIYLIYNYIMPPVGCCVFMSQRRYRLLMMVIIIP